MMGSCKTDDWRLGAHSVKCRERIGMKSRRGDRISNWRVSFMIRAPPGDRVIHSRLPCWRRLYLVFAAAVRTSRGCFPKLIRSM